MAETDDYRHDDLEYDPAANPPQEAKAWLNLLQESEDAFEEWNARCDNADKIYANLERLANNSSTGRAMRDREFSMFWANCEVIKPSIYASAPIPVVSPKFKDRRPVYQQASEVMERCCIVAFDLTRINDLMLLVRDDLALLGRGVAWCRYESKGEGRYDSERVCIDFKARRDFLHSISRNWREVTWVAAASYLTRPEARKRFKKFSGDEYLQAEYKVNKDSKEVGGADNRERAKFWEIWNKGDKKVLWVSPGCENILDTSEPHLELQNYFPCPKPAYGTLQRGSLVPVPDVMQYRDQLDEINLLTGRIHALSDSLEAKGFYPAGGAELADAIQTAVQTKTAGRLLIPISNWAAFGGSKEVIVWWPVDMIATTITQCVMLRKQIIEDVQQLTGINDIMRGDSDAQETLGAQKLKNQYGTTRIRDKQQELVRLARDLVEITSQIITEKFSDVTMIEMSQTQLRTDEMVKQDADGIEQQLKQLEQQVRQQIAQAQQPPQDPNQQGQGSSQQGQQQSDPQQIIQQAQQQAQPLVDQLKQLGQEPTIEQVLYFLKDTRAKSFVLDIETDSTIMADEDGEKQRRTEFVGMLGALLPQLSAMITADPKTAPFCGEILKFSSAPFRAGRSLDAAIDELVEQMKEKGNMPQQQNPQLQIEQLKQQTAQQKMAQDAQLAKAKLDQDDKHKQWDLHNQIQIKSMELAGQQGEQQIDLAVQTTKAHEGAQKTAAEIYKTNTEAALTQQKGQMQIREHEMKQQDHAAQATERQEAARMKAMQQPKSNGGI